MGDSAQAKENFPGMTEEEINSLVAGVTYSLEETGAICLSLHPVTRIPIIQYQGYCAGIEARHALEDIQKKLADIKGNLIIDLEECEYLPSEMIGFITKFAFERHEARQKLFLCAVPRKVAVTLALLDMDDFFHMRQKVEDAVAESI